MAVGAWCLPPVLCRMATKRAAAPTPPPVPNRPPYLLIEEIRVQGYKSLVDATLHVRPLTLLAGTNSSGKSSIMQPLLLIKQTMEASYQPAGALVLSGAHVQAETAGELVSKIETKSAKGFSVNIIGLGRHLYEMLPSHLALYYKIEDEQFKIERQVMLLNGESLQITEDDTWEELENQFSYEVKERYRKHEVESGFVNQVGAFLSLFIVDKDDIIGGWEPDSFKTGIGQIMHIPGLRGAPKRSYLTTSLSKLRHQIEGTFDLYVAGTISQWQKQGNTEALAQLNDSLQRLGLTNAITAEVKNANEVELSVNRLPATSKAKPKKANMVNIADVGIGVSQVLPILVALIAAQEGQIVYIEQPELHLHPRAQVAMGELLAEAANRGVRVIVETHSSLLLLTIQTLIAQGKIANTDVGLHWFTRDAKGASNVQYVQPDEDGAYGEWPEDFSEIELKAQDAYLTAVGLRQFGEAAT